MTKMNNRESSMSGNMIRFLIILTLLLCSGCAGRGYVSDRARDAADMITVSFGGGAGMRGQFGPLHMGILTYDEIGGLRGGASISQEKDSLGYGREIELVWKSNAYFYPQNDFVLERGKAYNLQHAPFFNLPKQEKEKYPTYFFTQVEVIFAAVGGIRLGINPGEMLDFILGWTTLDIYGDDLPLEKEE